MITEGSRLLRVVAVGDETTRATLSESAAGDSPALAAEVVGPDDVDSADIARWNADCVLVDDEAAGDGAVDLVETFVDERPELPVVVLVGESQQRSVDALSAGAINTLPRRLPERDAELFVDRLEHGIEAADSRPEASRQALFESVADGLVVHHPETGEILDVNQRYCEITGYSREELVGEEVRTVLPDDQETYDDAVERIRRAREEGSQLFEFEGERRDGETFVGEVHLAVVTLDGRERVVASVRDVTDRKRQERAVRALEDATEQMQDADTSEELAETAVDAVADALELPIAVCWWHDPDGGRLVPAAATEEAREEGLVSELSADRYEYEVFQGGTVTQYVPGDEGNENPLMTGILLPLGDHGLIAAGRHEDVEHDDVRLDVIRTLAEHTITALERIERATEVRESERRFRMLMDRIDQVVYLGSPDLSAVFYINPAYEKLWGRTRETLYEDPERFLESIDSRDREEFVAQWGEMRADVEDGDPDESYGFEFRIRRPDGEVRWIDDTVYPLELPNGEGRLVGFADDVTERKRREREYEQIFHGVNDAIVIQDPETAEPLDANRTFLERLGYDDVEEIREEGFDALSATEAGYTRERAQKLCHRVVETGEAETVEWQQETKDGERRWIEAKVDSAVIGGEQRIVSMQRDVTERRQRQREYEQIFNGVNDAIAIFDPETGEITDVNETYHQLLGYDDLESIQELGIEGLSATDEGYTGERGQQLVRKVNETGEPETIEWRAEGADGDRIWLEVTLSPGEIRGEERVLSIQRDVTERRRREREYEQIFNGVNDIINVYDPGTGDLLDVNDTMCELTGYDRETLLERGLEAVSATDEGFTGRRASEITAGVMDSGESRELEWQLESADGERIWLDVKATPARINGERRLLTISRDVTDRRRTERRLRAILDRIDEAIFFARAHELDEASPAPDFVSSGYEEIWGLPLEEMHARYEEGFFGTLHPDHEGEYRAHVDDILRDIDRGTAADRYSIEYRIERPDGEVRWVHSDYYPVYWDEEPVRLAVVSRDVTDRKARERRMASFEAATEDLTTADTPERATRMAVEAAVETLDLPAVGAFLYDDDDGVLRPEALAGSVRDGATIDAIGPGDGPLWDAFATGTIVDSGDEFTVEETDGAPQRNAGDSLPLDAWRAIPLGNHGLLLAGTPHGAFGSDAIQSTHVLAATLEAALNYHRGRQRLAAREEQLRTQTRRAERLDRVARLAQQVEAAITEATAPAEVERAVCERLADSGPYDLAWSGTVDVGVDRIAPSTVVGASKRYVNELPLTTTDDGDAHPAVRAWQTNEVRVTESLVADGPAGDWRRQVLSKGYQSICAVPLTYDGLTYGVLTVGAEEPNAFGDRERELLEQLGTSVGNALAAIERRRALESDETVELEFSGTAVELPFARAAREAGCEVHHERTVAGQGGTASVYFRFEGDLPDGVDSIAKRELPGEVTVVAEEPSELLVEARTDGWFGSPLAEYGAVLRDASATPEETTVSVEVSAQADVRSFVDRLREMAPSLELAAKRQHRSEELTAAEAKSRLEEALTERQHEVIRTALSAGYFEWPRENDGSEVAQRLGITQPTLNKHLRLAERKTFEFLFESGA